MTKFVLFWSIFSLRFSLCHQDYTLYLKVSLEKFNLLFIDVKICKYYLTKQLQRAGHKKTIELPMVKC